MGEAQEKLRRIFELDKQIDGLRAKEGSFGTICELEKRRHEIMMEGRVATDSDIKMNELWERQIAQLKAVESSQFSEHLKKAIEEGFVVIDKQTRTARIGEVSFDSENPLRGIAQLRRALGLGAELQRLGYRV